MRFEDVAHALGLPPKLAYTVAEVSQVTGVPVNTIYDEIAARRLHCFLPRGRRRGQLLRPEHVDRWMDEGER